ncbi:MAG: hypothetical protein IJ797_00640 [Selenomonadaceae bacterium]|nr:hypothetical protein [Selenomonadaceae bacterium]
MTEQKKKGVNTKKGFIFFNCDANKSEQSMNIFYNHVVYKDTQASRKLLWSRVKKERDEKRINIEEDKIDEIKRLILEDDPTKASDFMQFGAIKVVDCL